MALLRCPRGLSVTSGSREGDGRGGSGSEIRRGGRAEEPGSVSLASPLLSGSQPQGEPRSSRLQTRSAHTQL